MLLIFFPFIFFRALSICNANAKQLRSFLSKEPSIPWLWPIFVSDWGYEPLWRENKIPTLSEINWLERYKDIISFTEAAVSYLRKNLFWNFSSLVLC